MNVPRLTIGRLHDSRYRFDQYWDRLNRLNVPTPKTEIIELLAGDPIPECPTEDVIEFMESNGLANAFVRSGYKAAVDRFRDGSIIHSCEADVIEETVTDLLTQHVRNDIPHGNLLVVRERIDLDYCMEPSHSHAPEIRYFVDEGKIITQTPDYTPGATTVECPLSYSFIEERFEGVETPRPLAERVAQGFADSPHSWSVDIILDAHGEWWVTEMHINGIYWNRDRKQWMSNCGHGDKPEYSPKWIHGAALPNL